MKIYVAADFTPWDNKIRDMQSMPNPRTILALNRALTTAFEATQAAVHIDTHSLKSSGKKSSDRDRIRNRWEGIISYGGATTGIKNPVNYAMYERARGGPHDFFHPLPLLIPTFARIVRSAIR